MSKIELPPLPSGYIRAYVPWYENLRDVEDLMRARDRQIVELCASLCAKYASQRQDDYEGSDYAQGLCDAAEDCAEEIRSLLDEKK